MPSVRFLAGFLPSVLLPLVLFGVDPAAPIITNILHQGTVTALRFTPYPGAQQYQILSGTDPATTTQDTNFLFSPYVQRTYTTGTNQGTNFGFEWRRTNSDLASGFFRLGVVPSSSNTIVSANVLNRMAYGPTPDELARLSAEGPEPYMAEQLAPWTITEDVTKTHTNIGVAEAKFAGPADFVTTNSASFSEFRAWHMLRAVGAQRQFLEILVQFLENHFVTEFDKTRDYFSTYYTSGTMQDRLAAQTEYLENLKWREALLNPNCTFYDLLKISAQSPAMIVYLDTYSSRGDSTRVANENYARELLELFTFGVDNGYDQNDITVMSRAWTGWTLDKVDFDKVGNPFAITTTNIIPGSTNLSMTTKSNLYGAWTMVYRSNYHNTTSKTVFPGKTVPARFGAPWAGANYQLVLNNGSGTNGIKDGYDVIRHLADQPFTQEFISIKLCRLLVHEGFPSPSTDSSRPEYAFYDYTLPELTPEAKLVHDCMLAWESSSPKGQVWKVLTTIVNSDLFRSHASVQQKIKTPLELVVSAIRALRASTNGSNLADTFTSFTDGHNVGSTVLSRMGEMRLFNRDSPDGYPEAGAPWISAGTLAERLRFLQAFCIAPSQSGHSDAGDARTACDPVGLLKAKVPASVWKSAPAVADFFIGLLFPGEGAGNLALYRDAAIQFLNTDDSGKTSNFDTLAVSSTANSSYDNRVRGVVGMLMTMQRFQEQ